MIGLVTVFCPLTMTGAGRLVVQTDETRSVVDCRVKHKLPDQVRITLSPTRLIVSCGGIGGKVKLNTVPKPEVPPTDAVPYSVLLVNTKLE